MALPLCIPVADLTSALLEPRFDAFILIGCDVTQIPDLNLQKLVNEVASVDLRVGKEVVLYIPLSLQGIS